MVNFNNPNRLQKVGVLRQHQSHIEPIKARIMNQVRCEIHIRTLFFAVDNLHMSRPTGCGMGKRTKFVRGQKCSEMVDKIGFAEIALR